MLTNQDDIKILSKKDYIRNQRRMDIEVFTLLLKYLFFFQMRRNQCVWKFRLEQLQWTFWASLEHEIHYKKFSNSNVEAVKQLTECADVIYETDMKMLKIRKNLLDEED